MSFSICQYHLCKKETKVYKCKYCKQCFCSEHLKAKPPGMPRFSGTSYEDHLFMNEWHKKNGHPCIPYIKYWEKETLERRGEYSKALQRWLGHKSSVQPRRFNISNQYYLQESEFKISKKLVNWVFGIFLGLLLFVSLYAISSNQGTFTKSVNCTDGTAPESCSSNRPFYCERNGTLVENPMNCGCPEGQRELQDKCIQVIKCSDGTFASDCSINKPYQCVNGTLIKNSTACGCPYYSNIKQIGTDCIDLSKPDIPTLEKNIHDRINTERQKSGMKPLVWDDKLANIARKHSQDMAQNNFFDHTNLVGEGPTERGNNAGYNCHKDYRAYYTYGIAENILQGWTYGTIYYTNGIETGRDWYYPETIAENTVNGWLSSEGHKKNILTETYDKEGIGIAIALDGKVLVTEDFC